MTSLMKRKKIFQATSERIFRHRHIIIICHPSVRAGFRVTCQQSKEGMSTLSEERGARSEKRRGGAPLSCSGGAVFNLLSVCWGAVLITTTTLTTGNNKQATTAVD